MGDTEAYLTAVLQHQTQMPNPLHKIDHLAKTTRAATLSKTRIHNTNRAKLLARASPLIVSPSTNTEGQASQNPPSLPPQFPPPLDAT